MDDLEIIMLNKLAKLGHIPLHVQVLVSGLYLICDFMCVFTCICGEKILKA